MIFSFILLALAFVAILYLCKKGTFFDVVCYD
jgi:hypothetical protein